MIKKIKKIKDFGIFQDYTAGADLSEFSRFNLFYGWNGSGKTTLSRLFNTLATKSADSFFGDAQFEFTLEGGGAVKHNSIANFNKQVFVFNQQFIEDNLDWKKQGAKSIVIISEDKIEERKRFYELKDVYLPKQKSAVDVSKVKAEASKKATDDFLTDLARSVKQSFQVIDTSDSHYFNYDRTKLKTFLAQNETAVKDDATILSKEALEELRRKVQPIQKPGITFSLSLTAIETLEQAEGKIKELLAKSVVNESIERLLKYPELNTWTEEGYRLHKQYESTQCEFCGSDLKASRIKELETHFSVEYKELMKRLEDARTWVATMYLHVALPDFGELYDELQEGYKTNTQNFIQEQENFNNHIKLWEQALIKKQGSPFATEEAISGAIKESIERVHKAGKLVTSSTDAHNTKTTNFEQQLKSYKKQLETHYVAETVQAKKYYELAEKAKELQKDNTDKLEEVTKLEKEMRTLEASLANVSKGAEEFNGRLKQFLGRPDISLQYDATEKGYRIIRSNSLTPASNLSEGEKTAIAFVYFIIKLTENGNKVQDSIVIVDDPISSFDSNHLFHSLAFLKTHCGEALQLFVLTHNFQYFKLVRDWLMGKNKKDHPTKSTLFTIEVTVDPFRSSSIRNAHASLVSYQSEYHFIFRKLYEYKDELTLDANKSYQIANYARKLLEAFFAFKHPKYRKDFSQLMEAGCKGGAVDDTTREKVYRFINKYSHNQAIHFDDASLDNVLGEGNNVTELVLAIMEKCDGVHYKEMEELCKN